jgi:hypothetical protein
MLDLAAIVFTTAVCVFVTFRALLMDRERPWFGREPSGGPPADEGVTWRRRG